MNTKIKYTLPFSITQKIKYLAVNVKIYTGLVPENYTMLVKEIKDNINKWKDKQHTLIGRPNIIKVWILSKLIQI